jgi:predicted RNA binding protein YcfA (HicA-like mRNA interferase family)
MEGSVSSSESRRRLEEAGYLFEPSRAGKHFWRHPQTGELLPEDYAYELVRREEERRLEEAGWERVEVGGHMYWCRPESTYLYPRGAAYDALIGRAEEERGGGSE